MGVSNRPTLNGKGMSYRGDKTSHGGIVLTGCESSTWDGVQQARLGDKVFCPKCKPNTHTISQVSGFPVHGVPCAVDGDLASCGAALIAQSASPQEVAAARAFMNGQGFDQALQFTDQHGRPLGKVAYRLHVGRELVYEGTTDADGTTARVLTEKPLPISKAFLQPAAPFCCAASLDRAGDVASMEINLEGITTSSEQLGESVVQVKVDVKARPMTTGEIAMCRLIFKDAIDYGRVKIHKGAFMPGAGDNAMTPFGEPHFPVKKDAIGQDKTYQEDFSKAKDPDLKVWFIHEMAHVWQYQLGYSVAWAGLKIGAKGGYRRGLAAYQYDYSEDPFTKQLSNFNMEQQAVIIANYFAIHFLKYADAKGEYERSYAFNSVVLKAFIKDPKNAKLLPENTDF